MNNQSQARFEALINSCEGLTPDSTLEDVYSAIGKLVSSNTTKRGEAGRTIKQQRDELYSISKDWKRDLTDFIIRKETEINNLDANSKGLLYIRYQAYQIFSNTDYKLHDIRLKNFSKIFFDALHYDRALDIQNKIFTEDYFQLFIITIYQMGDLYYFLPVLQKELEGLDSLQISDTGNKPTVAAYAIMHVYWSKHDSTKAITKTSVNTWAKQYGTSKKTLLDAYNEYKLLANRLEPRENTRTISEHVKRYESILPLLETLCHKAFNDATKDLDQIKERYQSYLK